VIGGRAPTTDLGPSLRCCRCRRRRGCWRRCGCCTRLRLHPIEYPQGRIDAGLRRLPTAADDTKLCVAAPEEEAAAMS
jgi:hypothetical protein